MNKQEYLTLLEDVLEQNNIVKEERLIILEDYEELFDGYKERGMDDIEIKKKLGSPYNVVAELKGSMKYTKTPDTFHEKFVAISPFIALTIFFIFGFLYDLWHPTWLIFFIIPVSAILLGVKKRFSAVLLSLMPFIATTLFVLYGYYTGVYHPTWMVYLLIVLFGFIAMEEPRKYIYILLLLVASGLYLYIGIEYAIYDISLLLYLPLFGVMLYNGHIEVTWNLPGKIKYVVIFTIIIYFLGGYLFDLWGVLWLIFFLIPLYAIYYTEPGKVTLVAYSPFIATAIFYLLGYWFDLWNLSWLAFLLIPILAILFRDDKKS